ncbi:MAG: hypothetical protein QG594_1171 [Bacteroidota bacterium]|nr:hypothetical protein [Bacteroidota bacterium]
MKQFLTFLLKTSLLLLILAFGLDLIYTLSGVRTTNRTKIDFVYNAPPQEYDVVMIGSSRANNHFVAEMFAAQGLKTFNYGMSGGHLFEADLILKLMLEKKYKIKNVILEADLNLSNDKRADGIMANFLPYLHQSKTIKEHFSTEEDFNYLYYIPFYRYIKYDSKIGFREFVFNIMNQKTSYLQHLGYHALEKTKKGKMKNDIQVLKPLLKNKYYEEIKQLCQKNKINFIPIMTPMCQNTKGIDYFDRVKKVYPEIYNYENVVVEDKYFSSCGHMNDTGARLFTARILKDFFNK